MPVVFMIAVEKAKVISMEIAIEMEMEMEKLLRVKKARGIND